MEKELGLKLYDAYYMRVFSYVMTLAKDRTVAEDVTQETFYKAMNSYGSFRKESDEMTWLCAIAKNLFYDEMRKRARLTDVPEDAEIDSGVNIEEETDMKDRSLRIHLVLHSLDEPYREVFELRVFGELSFSQIGTVFGKTENWARVTYHRARLKILERMGEK